MGDLILHGHLMADEFLASALTASGEAWSRSHVLHADDGKGQASVWRCTDSGIALSRAGPHAEPEWSRELRDEVDAPDSLGFSEA